MAIDDLKYRVAAVQAASVFLDLEAGVQKACLLIREAAAAGARLVAFPEVFIPNYPYWPRDGKNMGLYIDAFRRYVKQSVAVPSEATDRLCAAAREAKVHVAIGISERDAVYQYSLYNTILYIDDQGIIIGKHRKLMPTFSERCIWGMGDGRDFTVVETTLGRVGGLICSEHCMTLVKYALMVKGEQVHISAWPGMPILKAKMDVSSRMYAIEGQCFVVVASAIFHPDMVPAEFALKPEMENASADGGSGVINPWGVYIAGPEYGRETIVYGDCDFDEIIRAKGVIDQVGHYARWDLITLNVREEGYGPVRPLPALQSAWRGAEETRETPEAPA